MQSTIVPSYPAPSFEALENIFKLLSDVATEFQVDIVELAYAGSLSWPETEADPYDALRQLQAWTQQFAFEIDLMVVDPTRYFEVCEEVGAVRVVAHVSETSDVKTIIEAARSYSFTLALACTASVPLSVLIPYIEQGEIKAVQLMGIAKVGKQAQSFDERVLPRITELRRLFPELTIAVDGAVNATTLPRLKEAGANRFAPGSAVIAADDPAGAYKQLCELV